MPTKPVPFEKLLADDRETQLDQLARAMASEQGTPAENDEFTPELQDAAWITEDPNMTPELLMQVEQQAIAQAQEKGLDEQKTLELVKEMRVAARFPFRELVWTLGITDADPEEGIKRAEQVAKRNAHRIPPPPMMPQPAPVFPADAEMVNAQPMAAPEQQQRAFPADAEPIMAPPQQQMPMQGGMTNG